MQACPPLVFGMQVSSMFVLWINASILNDDVALNVWQHNDQPSSLVAGASCQPLSCGGSQNGGRDERAATLPAAPRCAHVLQAPLLLLENVVPAKSNGYSM